MSLYCASENSFPKIKSAKRNNEILNDSIKAKLLIIFRTVSLREVLTGHIMGISANRVISDIIHILGDMTIFFYLTLKTAQTGIFLNEINYFLQCRCILIGFVVDRVGVAVPVFPDPVEIILDRLHKKHFLTGSNRYVGF